MKHLFRNTALSASAAAMALLAVAAPVAAQQRDPAYAAAREAGRVGEQMDGYLGIVTGGDAELRRLVDDINIRRRAVYADKASENNATLEQYAFTAGCLAISRTEPGEKYQAPDGSWQTRTSSPPMLHTSCP